MINAEVEKCPNSAGILISNDLVSRCVADETVILDNRTGNYYSLDAHSDRIWQIIQKEDTVEHVLNQVKLEFDEPGEQAEVDVRLFLLALENAGILTLERQP